MLLYVLNEFEDSIQYWLLFANDERNPPLYRLELGERLKIFDKDLGNAMDTWALWLKEKDPSIRRRALEMVQSLAKKEYNITMTIQQLRMQRLPDT